jgi:uncharacterized protein
MSEWTTYHLEARTGRGFTLQQGQLLRVIDPEGEQVADLTAFATADITEWLCNGRTFDYNQTIYLTKGHVLYSNRSRPMLTITEDSVGRHDFLFAACSQEMFEIQYGRTGPHPNCLENLAKALSDYGVREHMIPTPFNIFMNVEMLPEGGLRICPPRSRPGDFITLRADMNLAVGLSACSAGSCNNYRCTPIAVEIST